MTLDEVKSLPVGTIVANGHSAFIKNEINLGLDQENWSSTGHMKFTDYEVFEYLDGRVMRHVLGDTTVLRTGRGSTPGV